MKKFFQQYSKLPWEKKIIWTAALVSLLPILAAVLVKSSSEAPEPKSAQAAVDVDTFIPKGFVLVPIEVQNYEALDSILGKFGVVDLFQGAGPDKPQQRLVAKNVRMLRAPQNPAHFAILVQESEAPRILQFGGSFTVIVRRPGQDGTEFVKGEATTRRSIVYEKE